MLNRLTKEMRIRAAIVLVALYSFGLIFPTVMFAATDGGVATHCLGLMADQPKASPSGHDRHGEHGDHGDLGHQHMAHGQADGVTIDRASMQHPGVSHQSDDATGSPLSDSDPQTKHIGSCCGLFCAAAVTAEFKPVGRDDMFASDVRRACAESLAGHGPARIDRPPSTTLMSS
jgi:hypothetical protein